MAKSSWVLLEKSVSAIPFSLSCVVSENLSYCDRSYCQTSYCVWKVSGLPWGAAWSTAGCGILQSACSVGSLCLLRWLEQGQGAHIRAALSALLLLIQRDGTRLTLWFTEAVFPRTWIAGVPLWIRAVGLSVWPPWCGVHSAELPSTDTEPNECEFLSGLRQLLPIKHECSSFQKSQENLTCGLQCWGKRIPAFPELYSSIAERGWTGHETGFQGDVVIAVSAGSASSHSWGVDFPSRPVPAWSCC